MSDEGTPGTAAGRRSGSRRRGNRGGPEVGQPVDRDVNYRQLKNPFPTMDLFSADQIEDMHQTALRMIEELGMKVRLPDARQRFAAGGARRGGAVDRGVAPGVPSSGATHSNVKCAARGSRSVRVALASPSCKCTR